jgi:hypothetical protein
MEKQFHEKSKYVKDMLTHEHAKSRYVLANGEVTHRKSSYVTIDNIASGNIKEDK